VKGIGELKKMARKPGPMNPDSVAGNARLGVGRGSNAGRSQPIPKGSVPTPKKFGPPAGGIKETFNVEGITRRFKAMGYSEAQINKAIYKPQPRVVKPLPAAGSVDQVKLTAQQFGQKVSGKQAKAISALLRGRVK